MTKKQKIIDWLETQDTRPLAKDVRKVFSCKCQTVTDAFAMSKFRDDVKIGRHYSKSVIDGFIATIDAMDERPKIKHLMAKLGVSNTYAGKFIKQSRHKNSPRQKREVLSERKQKTVTQPTVLNDLNCGELSVKMLTGKW